MISKLRVEPGTAPQLARRDPAGRLDSAGKEEGKALLQPAKAWRRRPRHSCADERLLDDEGTTVVKVFLHVS